MPNNIVSIIIINYKQQQYLLNCIKSIYDTFTTHPFEVIIINNSPEENIDDILQKYSDLKIIENKNKGFSQANNLGSKNSKGEYLLFLNCDTIIKNDFLSGVIEKFNDKDIGAIGLKMLFPDGTPQLSFWNENTFFNEFKNRKSEKYFKEKRQDYINSIFTEHSEFKEIEWISGAALIMKTIVFNNINGFDEDYFLFYEDADLCKRLKLKGFKIYFFPFSEIIHFKGENVNPDFINETYFYAKKSQLIYYKKHNNFFNRIMLRVYLFVKFGIASLMFRKQINFRIFKMICGIEND
jgi:hypothetical protein